MVGVGEFLASRNYAPASLKQRRIILAGFVDHVGDPAACDAAAVLDWWASTTGQAPWSRRTKLSAVRSLLDWLVQAGERADNPARLIRPPVIPRTPPKVLDGGQVAALRRVVDRERDHLMVELMLTCGLRVGEVAAIDADDLHRDDELLVVHGKGARTAMIPVPSWMVDVWPPPGSGSVFGVTSDVLRNRTKALLAAAGIDGHGPHSLRRTCGTELARRGVPLHVVASLLRHDSPQTTTRHYLHVSMDDLRRAVE